MNFTDTSYDEIYGVIEGTEDFDAAIPDEFETGGAGRYPTLQFLKGYKNPKLNANGKVTSEQAHGFMFSEDQIPDDLKDVLQALVKKGDVAYYKVKHSPKKGSDEPNIVGHYEILHPAFFVLAHATPYPDVIFDNEDKQKGLAAGYQTFLGKNNKGEAIYDRTKFLGALVVERHLQQAGYVDSVTGAPKPIRLSVLGYNADELYTVLSAHSNFIKSQRSWVAEQRKAQVIRELKAANKPVNVQQVGEMAKRFAVQHVQFFSYALYVGATEETKTHGQGQDSADVYEIEGKTSALYSNPEQADKELHCGQQLYRQLSTFVWDTSVRPPVVGGEAVEWCRTECAKWHKNEEELNPYRRSDKQKALKLGKSLPQPAYLKLRDHINDAAMLSRDAVEGNGHGRAGFRTGDAGQAERADAYVVWNKHKATIEAAKDAAGLAIINKALRQIDGIVQNEGEISSAEEARIIRAASIPLGKRARELEMAGVEGDDPF